MHREIFREGGVRVRDLLQGLLTDRRAVPGGGFLRVRGYPAVTEIAWRSSSSPADLLEDDLQALLEARQDLFGVLDRDVAAADQCLGVKLADRPLLFDQVIHPRLGETRIVALVVAATAIAHEV